MTNQSAPLQRRWENLLAWLRDNGFQAQDLPVGCREMSYAGNGLFARSACMPGALIFAVPPKVLMNKMTLKRLYSPSVQVAKTLSAVQLISMHLFIWRPKANNNSADPFFGPYISILPRNFGGHPLTWLVLSRLDRADEMHVSLLNSLPPSVLAALHCLHTRFWNDWCKVRAFLRKTPSVTAASEVLLNGLEVLDAVMDFLWAWLNVNTRSIYYRLKHSETDPDNLTMCPILDFANHTPGQACMIPVPSNSKIWNAAPVSLIGDGLKFNSPENVKIEENDEILLTYGSHSNKTLFVEYGFLNPFSKDGPSPSGEVDVQDLVERYVFTNVQLGEAVKVALVTENYWANWSLHATSDSAQPSWRLIIALRLYHLAIAVGSADRDAIQPWRDVITGMRQQVSCENEQSCRQTTVQLCDMLIKRAEISIASHSVQHKHMKEVWVDWMSENIQSLWREELFVARAVKKNMLRGDEF